VSIAMRAASTAKFRIDRHLICEIDSIVSLYGPYDAKGFKLFNKAGAVLLNNDKKQYVGKGVSMIDQWEHPVTSAVTAHDLQVLNEGRLDMLRDNRINQESLEVLNSTARDLQEDSQGQVTADALHGFLAASAAMARRAYIPLVNVIKDLVTAVVLLLLLAMPFAYSLERLLIGTPHIYRQIGWFAVFFVATFIVLYFVNPAFRLAATPIVIFLAFGIIVLSSLVIFIMTRKLQAEIKKMQGLAATVHSADVSRLSTMMAAVHMGISTMRRRPLRTLLTATTVVLLTFTILTFASFGTSWGTRTTYEETLTGPARVLARHQLWNPIGEGVFNALRGYLTKEAQVVPRYWISPTATNVKEAEKTDVNFERLVTSANGDYIAPVAAAIGLDRRDIDRQSEIEDLFAGQIDLLEADGIFLTDAVREELHLTVDDIGVAKVLLLGHPFTYAGVVTDKLAGFTMLEGSSMLPVDYRSSGGGSVESFTQDEAMATETLSEMPDIESAQFVTYNLHMNVIIAPRMAKLLGGQIRSITIYPNNIEDIQDLAQRVARVSELPTYVGDAGGVYRLIFTSLATASGWRDLLIPITLGGLIIFATMLGSISDREREIYTFSSLGLAPPHVASLFFAEASVYAFIGGMGGYLLGQVAARVMGWLSGMGLVSVPAMNYSSTNAIVTILIVMCTVMISTIYPAAKASRSANPGIQRSWQIPKPAGDLYDLVFPFTVSTYDITGVVSFLREHFDNYTDTSLGVFATIKGHIFRQRDNDMLGFTASVALAPFDLGVTQNFAILSQPSEIEGIDEIRILLYRLSGARGDWQRSNRVFIKELRKQLLIWRSLSPQVMDRYRQQTLEKWDALPREQIDPQTVGETM
ncbi:MAG: ABC transporter permease, partial [Phycisphaerae bacterium]|nr:ABC transporter permease [Phycisphaerae bacterium]